MASFRISLIPFILILTSVFHLGLCIPSTPISPTPTPVPDEGENDQTAFKRVLGGEPAEDFVTKRMAHIHLVMVNDKYGFSSPASCTGTVIRRFWLLTAAHCFFKKGIADSTLVAKMNDSFAVVGQANATFQNQDTGIEPYWFKSIFVHKDFVHDPDNIANDIALINLRRPIEISNFAPISISPFANKRRLVDREVSAAGYGVIDNMETRAEELMETKLVAKKFGICTKRTAEEVREFLEDDKVLCAVSVGFPKKGKTDTCTGDSGGPLFIGDEGTNTFFQIGITSFGASDICAQPGSVAWYTRISYYYYELQQAFRGDLEAWKSLE